MKDSFVHIMINGTTVPTQEQLMKLLPKYHTMVEEGNRIFYRVGEWVGPVAAWDKRLKTGVILDDYRKHILELRRKRSER